MKDIEINSDKTTVVVVVFILVSMLVSVFSDLIALASHRVALVDLHFWDYLIALFNVYAAVVICRDANLRKNYPFGVAGMCLIALVLVMRIAAHWAGRSPAAQDFFWTSMTIVSIASSGLVLVEGARWLRRKVTLTNRSASRD